jgi:hypothetical protein
VSGGAEPWAGPGQPDCDVYWGTHGCGLVEGHPEPDRHVCGYRVDGACSEIRWAQDPRTGLWVWDWRFSSDGVTFGGQAFPTQAFGVDVPADRHVSPGVVDMVHAVRQSAGELAVMRGGRWVRASDGAPWID